MARQAAQTQEDPLDIARGVIDELGVVKKERKRLEAREEQLRDALADTGLSGIVATSYVLERDEYTETKTDWRSIAERLEPSRQLVRAHTKRVPKVRIRIEARKD